MATVLVTGGGGFVGRHIVRRLVARGEDVRTLGRRGYDYLPGEVDQVVGDVRDQAVLRRAAEGCDAIVHTAALAGVMAERSAIERINIAGTANALQAAAAANVLAFVYTSSPSVVFGTTGHIAGDESLPYPERYLDHYPRTKAAAERLVLAASDTSDASGGLRTVALRPHLVFGPEDTNLHPRLVDRSRRGRLRIVGRGDQPISVAYVENVAAAHLQALDELRGAGRCRGRAYFINEKQPVETKAWINTLLAMAGEPACERHVPARLAYGVGGFLETAWRVFARADEPPMTRFVAKQLSEPHSFRTAAAERDFGYCPPVSWAEALGRTERWARARFASESEGD